MWEVRRCLHPGFLVGWSREPFSPKIKLSRCVGEAGEGAQWGGEVAACGGKGCKGVSKSLGGLGSGCPWERVFPGVDVQGFGCPWVWFPIRVNIPRCICSGIWVPVRVGALGLGFPQG